MLPTNNSDRTLETAILNLLERYALEDVVETLYNYTNLQAGLANILQQTQAAVNWKKQAEALQNTFQQLDEVYDEEFFYLVY
jgi:L-lactate utilization protein LutC